MIQIALLMESGARESLVQHGTEEPYREASA